MSNKLQGFDSSGVPFLDIQDTGLEIHWWLSVLLGLTVIGPMLYFAWKYRADKVKDEEIGNVTHHTLLEVAWTVIPTAILMVFFYYGYEGLKQVRSMPDESKALVVNVVGSKWKWEYEYPPNSSGYVHRIGYEIHKTKNENGVVKAMDSGINALYVPEDTPVILKMTAPLNDVIHSYYVPAFRMKEDVVPGRVTKQWFQAKAGVYDVECAEYCGQDHSYMYSKVVVLPKEEFKKWFESTAYSPKGAPKVDDGRALYEKKGCVACHGSDGKGKPAYGQDLTIRMTKEQVLDVIKNGQDQLKYPMGAMPAGTAEGEAAEKIAEWIASGAKGAPPAEFAACAGCHGADGKGNGGMSPNLVEFDQPLIKQLMKHGKSGIIGDMPGYFMTDEEIAAITKYLQSL